MKNIKCIIRTDLKRQDYTYLIYLRYTYNRRFILFKIDDNVSVSKANWNAKSGRVRKSFNFELTNNILTQKENELSTRILELIAQKKEPTLINVKIEYYRARNQYQVNENKPKKQDERRFLKDFKEFIEYREENDKVSEETLKTYKTTYNKLVDFQKETNYPLHYDTINNEFYDKFLNYLRGGYSKKEDTKRLYDNSVDKHIKNLKLFMYDTLEKQKHNNVVFQTFKRTKSKADFVVLDRDELQKLYYEYKPKTKSLEEIRDTFIFGCATGLRFSDLTSLTIGNFVITREKETNEIIQNASYSFINVPVQKTTDYVKLPLNPFICDMIDKYKIESEGLTFLKQNNQVFNREIKKICRDAGIIEQIKVSKKMNSKLVPNENAKCEFISSHTMRRTFITLLSNMTEITNIQAVSGHKDIKVLTDYIKRNDKELNSVRACFNDVFSRSITETPSTQPAKVKATIIKTRVISR